MSSGQTEKPTAPMSYADIVKRNMTPSSMLGRAEKPKQRIVTFEELIDECDAGPYKVDGNCNQVMEKFLTVQWQDNNGIYDIGYMMEYVVKQFLAISPQLLNEWGFSPIDKAIKDKLDERIFPLHLLLSGRETKEARTATIGNLMRHWRANRTFRSLEGWKVNDKGEEEMWAVYGKNIVRKDVHGQNVYDIIFDVQRGAAGLLGVVRYGTHMTAYCTDSNGKVSDIWVPRRSSKKDTYPLYLDNSVAGGLATGEDHRFCVAREAWEEAGLDQDKVKRCAVNAGLMTYLLIVDEGAKGDQGHIYPESEYIYDLKLSQDVELKKNDDEVDSFEKYSVPRVKELLKKGLFKTNCSVVLLDFFQRHDLLLTDEEKSIIPAIKKRLFRDLPFPGPHSTFKQPEKEKEPPVYE